MGAKKLTLSEIKEDSEVLRLRAVMSDAAKEINKRLDTLFRENGFTPPPSFFEVLTEHNQKYDDGCQSKLVAR